jgi:MazG family protein
MTDAPHTEDTPLPRPGADHADTAPGTLDRGLALVRFLRANCPWDAAQTAETLIPHLLEESQEVAHAVRTGDARELEGELGDLLLNLAFQVVVAEEAGTLTADSVTRRLEEKMRRRHPHLYGIGPREDWETIKARERAEAARAAADAEGEAPHGAEAVDGGGGSGGSRILEGLTPTLDSLSRAHRMQERVARVGFDWEDHRGAWAKVAEELEEVREALEEAGAPGTDGSPAGETLPTPAAGRERVEEELGDLLFAVVNLVRLAGTHPITVLDRANAKFHRRFEALERLADSSGVQLGSASLEELDRLWDQVKAGEG